MVKLKLKTKLKGKFESVHKWNTSGLEENYRHKYYVTTFYFTVNDVI